MNSFFVFILYIVFRDATLLSRLHGLGLMAKRMNAPLKIREKMEILYIDNVIYFMAISEL